MLSMIAAFHCQCDKRGLDKTILRSLPRIAYNANVNGKLSECAICLMEYVDGDAIRVLPHCGHTFHMNCVDRLRFERKANIKDQVYVNYSCADQRVKEGPQKETTKFQAANLDADPVFSI
ncbi:hypothetical protein FEM48_Zijuj09G0150500 [Ziziphus jujuba var. spinosa]|uniref:RING-type domain-containing protein n=1 Tax=Ziziphus jujuba var. spinosa TaxID=714518 RepID=A0A978UTP1_ZIZJJ|nr:hypothetical protein FEM48_Zijuj09G0150500 [Ziziphus jujuba var. spinosa]